MNDIKALCVSLQDLNRDVSILQGAIEFVRVGREYLGEKGSNLVSDIMWVLENHAKCVSVSANDAELHAIRIRKSREEGKAVERENCNNEEWLFIRAMRKATPEVRKSIVTLLHIGGVGK